MATTSTAKNLVNMCARITAHNGLTFSRKLVTVTPKNSVFQIDQNMWGCISHFAETRDIEPIIQVLEIARSTGRKFTDLFNMCEPIKIGKSGKRFTMHIYFNNPYVSSIVIHFDGKVISTNKEPPELNKIDIAFYKAIMEIQQKFSPP